MRRQACRFPRSFDIMGLPGREAHEGHYDVYANHATLMAPQWPPLGLFSFFSIFRHLLNRCNDRISFRPENWIAVIPLWLLSSARTVPLSVRAAA